MSDTLPNEVREAMARALVAYNTIPEFYEQEWPKCLPAIDAALSALEAAGWRCVRNELSEADENINCDTLLSAVRLALHGYYEFSKAVGLTHTTRIVFERAMLSATLQREADGMREALEQISLFAGPTLPRYENAVNIIRDMQYVARAALNGSPQDSAAEGSER